MNVGFFIRIVREGFSVIGLSHRYFVNIIKPEKIIYHTENHGNVEFLKNVTTQHVKKIEISKTPMKTLNFIGCVEPCGKNYLQIVTLFKPENPSKYVTTFR